MKQQAVVLALIVATSACASNDTNDGPAAVPGRNNDSQHELTAEQRSAVAKIERGYPRSSWARSEDPTEAHCIAIGMVTEFGIEKLQKYGVVDADLEFDKASSKPMSAPDAALFTEVELSCGNFEANVAAFIAGENAPMSDTEMERCVAVVTKDDFRRASEDFLQDDATGAAALYTKLHKAACGPRYRD